ncbi:MAG: hypothetical protein AB1725_08345 [Armatimonadota bacterium]
MAWRHVSAWPPLLRSIYGWKVMDEFNELSEEGRRLYSPTLNVLPDGRLLVIWFAGSAPAGGSEDAAHSQRYASGAEESSEQQSMQQHKRRKPR